MASPRFSPISSDYGGRALSPTLSASSRTTTSLPTDVSDLSSLDGDEDFEMIDAPRSDRGETSDEGQDGGLHESFDDLAYRSSYSLLSTSMVSRASNAFTDRSSANQDLEESHILLGSNSMTPMGHSGMLESSTTSSQLKFPDPLDSSFQHLDNSTEKSSEQNTPQMEQNVDEEANDMADRATLTDSAEETLVPDETIQQSDRDSVLKVKMEEPSSPSTPAPFPAPPFGFPFKIDRMDLAKKALRTLIPLLMVLLASGVMPVWRSGSPLPISTTPSTFKLTSTTTGFVTPTPFAQLNKSLSIISSKASKGLIAVGKASSFGTQKCSHQSKSPKVMFKEKRIQHKCGKGVPIRSLLSESKDLMDVKHVGEVAVFQPETSYSALAAEWLLTTPSKLSPIQMSKQKESNVLSMVESGLLSRLDRPSRAAKSLARNFKKSWLSKLEGSSGDFVEYLASIAVKESRMLQSETANILRNMPPKTRQLISALQKSWDVWMREVMKAYAKLRVVLQEEMVKVQEDFSKVYRKSDKMVRKFSKQVMERHHALEELTRCQLKLYSMYAEKGMEYKEKAKFYMKLQQSAWKSMPSTVNEAKEACAQLKLSAQSYRPKHRSFGGGKRKKVKGRRNMASFARSLRKRSDGQFRESVNAIKRARKQAERALRRS